MLISVKFVFDATTNIKDLYSFVTDDQTLKCLDLIGETSARTAVRMLDEARAMQGQVRRCRLQSAVDELEKLYTVLDYRAKDIAWWRAPRAAMERIDTYKHATNIALIIAALRRALDNDGLSARPSVDNAMAMFARYEKLCQNRIEREYRFERFSASRRRSPESVVVMLRAARSTRENKLHTLVAERQALNARAASIIS